MPPPRTDLSIDDLRHLDVVQRILGLLNEPTASARELAKLVEEMPVLAARLAARFTAKVGRRPSNAAAELAYLGNRDFEVVLFQLLEELTELRGDHEGVPAHGSVYPTLTTLQPPTFENLAVRAVPWDDEPMDLDPESIVNPFR